MVLSILWILLWLSVAGLAMPVQQRPWAHGSRTTGEPINKNATTVSPKVVIISMVRPAASRELEDLC
jgi:hypothetical protein